MGGRQKVEVPTGGRPGWGEGACSASDEGVRAGVCAASEGSEWVAQGPGLEPGFHVDQQAVPENSWVPAAYAAHFERPAAGSGVDAGLRPGLRGLRALDKATGQKRKKQTNKKKESLSSCHPCQLFRWNQGSIPFYPVFDNEIHLNTLMPPPPNRCGHTLTFPYFDHFS